MTKLPGVWLMPELSLLQPMGVVIMPREWIIDPISEMAFVRRPAPPPLVLPSISFHSSSKIDIKLSNFQVLHKVLHQI